LTLISAVIQNDRQVIVKLEGFSKQVRDEYLKVITEAVARLLPAIRAATPSKTGATRASIQGFVDDRGDKITGKVKALSGGKVNILKKTLALEYGAKGQSTVKAYERSITTVFGKAIEPRIALISAYTRTMNIAPQNFMRGPFEAMRSQITAQMIAVPEEVAKR
jgi:hypothetical protein